MCFTDIQVFLFLLIRSIMAKKTLHTCRNWDSFVTLRPESYFEFNYSCPNFFGPQPFFTPWRNFQLIDEVRQGCDKRSKLGRTPVRSKLADRRTCRLPLLDVIPGIEIDLPSTMFKSIIKIVSIVIKSKIPAPWPTKI